MSNFSSLACIFAAHNLYRLLALFSIFFFHFLFVWTRTSQEFKLVKIITRPWPRTEFFFHIIPEIREDSIATGLFSHKDNAVRFACSFLQCQFGR